MVTPIFSTTARQPDGYSVSVVDVTFPSGPVSAGDVYTIDFTFRIDEVPGFLGQDHCQDLLNGGAGIRTVVTDSAGETVSSFVCVSGPEGSQTSHSIDVTTPVIDSDTLTPTVEFVGGDQYTGSGVEVAPPASGTIEYGGGNSDGDDGSGFSVTPPEYIELGEVRFQDVVNRGDRVRFDVDIVSNWDAASGMFATGNHPDYCAAGAFNIRPGGNVTAEVNIVGWASDGSSVCVSSAEDITQVQTLINAPTTPGAYDVEVVLRGTVSGEVYGTNRYQNALTIPDEEDEYVNDPSDDPDPGEDDPQGIDEWIDRQFGELIPGVGGQATALGILFMFIFMLVLLSSVASSASDAVNPLS